MSFKHNKKRYVLRRVKANSTYGLLILDFMKSYFSLQLLMCRTLLLWHLPIRHTCHSYFVCSIEVLKFTKQLQFDKRTWIPLVSWLFSTFLVEPKTEWSLRFSLFWHFKRQSSQNLITSLITLGTFCD